MTALSFIDLVTIGIYAVATLVLGIWYGRGQHGMEDFFLAGRKLSWPMIGLSYYASNMSGASFVGLTAAAYVYGIPVFNYEWTATLVLIVFALFILPTFLRQRIFTVPEYLERRFDVRARRAYSAFTVVAVLLIDTAGALYAGGLVVATAFPILSFMEASIVMGVLAGLYTTFGGLRSVVITDVFQAVLIILGGGTILVVGLDAVGGWQALMEGLESERLHLIRPADDAFLPWPGIFGVILLGFYYWALNQYFVQRALGARDYDHARRGALFGGLLKLPNLFIIIVPGIIAYRLFPDLPHPDFAFPALAFELLPAGLRGLILTALVAAIMSSLDSALNAVSSLMTMDFVRPLRPSLSERGLLSLGRLFTGAALLLGLLYVPVIREFETLFDYFQQTLAYVTPPVVAVYLIGLVWPRATAGAAFHGLALGIALGVVVYAAELSGLAVTLGLPRLHFTVAALVVFAITAMAVIAESLASPPPPPESRQAVIRRADLTAGRSLARTLWETALLTAVLAGLILAFW